jgi:protein-S-isoprenylcysteine O-methyltransferase Ste14
MNDKPKIVPPSYFYICIVICIALYFVFPKYSIIVFPYNLAGIILIIAGIIFVLWPWYSFKKHNTPEDFSEPTALVTEGSYAVCRNPMYLGGVLILSGLAVCLGNLLCFTLPIFFFLIMNSIFIPYEEKKMYEVFGDGYLQYKQKTRRWV